MGSKASKPVQSATRKFPARPQGAAMRPPPPPPPQQQQQPPPPPRARPAAPRASAVKDDAIRQDGSDPDLNAQRDRGYGRRLAQMGVATPSPTLSNSSTAASPPPPAPGPQYPTATTAPQNRTLGALAARERLEARARAEEDRGSGAPRSLVDVQTLSQVVRMRAMGASDADVERRFRLVPGVVGKLGMRGVVAPVG
ncbi:hypothetical protein F4780DRAFT_38010 [Xylariomycetidae sp. FL0641]|nr:hypothetical protein F4780DRAFT_38010 [Xylariomycetidae sp. FL0641]